LKNLKKVTLRIDKEVNVEFFPFSVGGKLSLDSSVHLAK